MSGIRAKKSLGQHWLVDRGVLRRIAEAVGVEEGDTVVEVGPGKGALTEYLASRSRHVIAVEVDAVLAERLRERADGAGLRVIEASVLELAPEEILKRGDGGVPYVVAGNLPYYIGTAIVRHFLTARVRPRRLVVMLQAEVAERMAASPGQMSALAVETQLFAEARVLFRIPAKAFRPPPKVQSAVVLLEVRDSPDVEVDDPARFMDLVHAGFAAPRKRLRNSLAIGLRVAPPEAGEILATAGVDPEQRPQMLDIDAWRDVYFAYRRWQAGRTE